jgi:6-phosphogluconolactonase
MTPAEKKLRIEYWVEADAAGAAKRAAQIFSEAARAAVEERGRARIAVSGGSTPEAAFRLLASADGPWRAQTPWERLELFWVDERCVPPDHAESNYRMTQAALLDRVPIAPASVHRMEGELEPELAAARYEEQLRRAFELQPGERPVFDLAALGMGEDGHTASLFPGTAALAETERLAVANRVAQKDAWRLTLTWPVINHARRVFFLIAGAAKAEIVREVFLGTRQPQRLPSQLIRPESGVLTLVLDRAAAALLPAVAGAGPGALERE